MFRERGLGLCNRGAEKPRPRNRRSHHAPVKAPTTDIGLGGVRIMRGMPNKKPAESREALHAGKEGVSRSGSRRKSRP